jgi:hypothetical protein
MKWDTLKNANNASPAPTVRHASYMILPTSHTEIAVSTNQRVQNFAWFTIFALAALGVWQIFHLRAFFKRKYLID